MSKTLLKGLKIPAEKRAHKKRQKQDLLNKGSLFDRLVVHVSLTSEY